MIHTAKHTPGPWKAVQHPCEHKWAWTIEGADGVVQSIARMGLVNDAQAVAANANLIAAAPAMYEALSKLVKYLREEVADEALDTWEPVFKAAMALAQAEGR